MSLPGYNYWIHFAPCYGRLVIIESLKGVIGTSTLRDIGFRENKPAGFHDNPAGFRDKDIASP